MDVHVGALISDIIFLYELAQARPHNVLHFLVTVVVNSLTSHEESKGLVNAATDKLVATTFYCSNNLIVGVFFVFFGNGMGGCERLTTNIRKMALANKCCVLLSNFATILGVVAMFQLCTSCTILSISVTCVHSFTSSESNDDARLIVHVCLQGSSIGESHCY